MSELLEALMMLSFGLAWPLSILKSYRSRTAKGKSLFFMLVVEFGYLCGIASKFVSGTITYVIALYFINLFMVATDICLHFRNRRLDEFALVPRDGE